MLLQTFGNKDNEAIVLIHGGGDNYFMWYKYINAFKDNYFIIVPTLTGHGSDNRNEFISIEDDAEKILYELTNMKRRIKLVVGFSLGAQIVLSMLSINDKIFERAIINSALVLPTKLLTGIFKIIYRMFYSEKEKELSNDRFNELEIAAEDKEDYIKEYHKLSKKSLLNMLNSNANFRLPANLKDVETKILALVGELELKVIIKSAYAIALNIENATLREVEDARHGGIIQQYDTYYKIIEDYLLEDFYEEEKEDN